MKHLLRAIPILTLLFASSALRAQPEVTGTSSITVGPTTVFAYGLTQLDYASAAYYDVGASVALFQGSDPNSLVFVAQDDEVAQRSSVNGQVTTTVQSDMVYEVDTAHYADLVYTDQAGFIDPEDFSSIVSFINSFGAPSDDAGYPDLVDYFAPGTSVETNLQELDFPDTFAMADTTTHCPTSIAATTPQNVSLPWVNLRTGIGTVFTMVVSGPDSNYAGSKITEDVYGTSRSCPIYPSPPWSAGCNGNDTFTVGQGFGTNYGTTVSPVQNGFPDFHATTSSISLLDYGGTSGCQITCAQSYSCGGTNIGNFTIVRTFTSSSTVVNGQTVSATAVTVTKNHN